MTVDCVSMEMCWKTVPSLCVFFSDGGAQHYLAAPNVGGGAEAPPAGGPRSGGGGGQHGAQHAAAKTQEQHLVSRIKRVSISASW